MSNETMQCPYHYFWSTQTRPIYSGIYHWLIQQDILYEKIRITGLPDNKGQQIYFNSSCVTYRQNYDSTQNVLQFSLAGTYYSICTPPVLPKEVE